MHRTIAIGACFGLSTSQGTFATSAVTLATPTDAVHTTHINNTTSTSNALTSTKLTTVVGTTTISPVALTTASSITTTDVETTATVAATMTATANTMTPTTAADVDTTTTTSTATTTDTTTTSTTRRRRRSTPSPSCTPEGKDPWATGKEIQCCEGLREKLKNWDGDGREYFKCVAASPSPSCTPEGVDPWATGKEVQCCEGLQEVLRNWDGDGREYFKCMPGDATGRRRRSVPVPPGDGHAVAAWMNRLYQGFDVHDDASPLGVTISMQNSWAIYCSEVGASCYQGHADCRFSGSLYNHKMMLNRQTNGIEITMNRVAGIVFNQTLVEDKIGKCSYMFDGASFNRYNGACGCVASSVDCSNPSSAFGNVCPSTGETCTVRDREVAQCSCENMAEPDRSDVAQCYWPGAGLDRGEVKTGGDQTRNMVKARLRHQDGSDSHDRLEYWNEVVVDEILMLEELRKDPTPVIPAFLYVKGNPAGIAYARQMRNDYAEQFSLGVEIPLVGVDPQHNVDTVGGPFFFDEQAMLEFV